MRDMRTQKQDRAEENRGCHEATMPALSVTPIDTADGGHYLVVAGDTWPAIVGRDRTCTCGNGSCIHVQAVTRHIRAGGRRAGKLPAQVEGRIERCPICGEQVTWDRYVADMWHCVGDSSHYWYWRAELNGGAIRKFMTGQRVTGVPAIDELEPAEYREYLDRLELQPVLLHE